MGKRKKGEVGGTKMGKRKKGGGRRRWGAGGNLRLWAAYTPIAAVGRGGNGSGIREAFSDTTKQLQQRHGSFTARTCSLSVRVLG